MTASSYYYSNLCQTHFLCLNCKMSWWSLVFDLLQHFFIGHIARIGSKWSCFEWNIHGYRFLSVLFTNIVCADDAFDHGFPYLDLPHQESSSFLYFIFGFGKESFSSFVLLFLRYTTTRYSYFISTCLIWISSMNWSIPLRGF